MTDGAIFAYALALAVSVASPGPAMLFIVGRSLALGARPAISAAFGIAFADVMLGGLALLGLAALMGAFSWLLTIVKYAGALYLLYLAIRMWRSTAEVAPANQGAAKRSMLLGMAVGLGNPKAILFHASLMPLIIDLGVVDLAGAAAILATIFLVTVFVMGSYAGLAGCDWFRKPSRLKWMKRAGAGSMLGAGAAIAAR